MMKTLTKLLKRAALLMALASTVHAQPTVTTVTIDTHVPGSTPTVTSLSDENFWGAEFHFDTYACTTAPAAVDCGTPTVKVPAICANPAIMKSPIDGSCAQIDFVNPNSTCHETKWVPCPN